MNFESSNNNIEFYECPEYTWTIKIKYIT